MKKATKIAAAAVSAVAVAGIAAASVFAWGDNAGGRRTYTLDEINSNALGDKIVFNSIVDDGKGYLEDGEIMPLTDERNFVGARDASTGNNGKDNVWNGNEINVEEGKEYLVRIYAHNNSPKGEQAISKNTQVAFNLPSVVDTEERVDGYITSDNAAITRYWDSVVFKSADGRPFYLDYVEGSALIENNGKVGGSKLDDSVVNTINASENAPVKGVKIGFDSLDGNVPGCYKYASYITIKVKPVFEDSSIEKKVRIKDAADKTWKKSVDAKVGDLVEYQIHYKNLNASSVNDVIIRDSLPTNMEYVKGTTVLYNTTFPKGASTDDDTVVTDGVNIGKYAVNGDGYVRFTAKVVDKDLACGNNRLINWAKATANPSKSTSNGFAVQNSADVYVVKDDASCKEKPTPTPTPEPTPTPTPAPTPEQPKELPHTGPAGVAGAALGFGATVTAAGYYASSKKQLRK